ncbi:MAG: hypothetical protein DLM72_16335 [Candidatus Nitrosopolaris wilkensis]|nr:MAG: hypothetical protein DLM72_16335 [Candidatus Nitrosopolaris wilkensis]
MDSPLTYVPLISVYVVAGLFVMALVNFSTMKKNMQKQSEQQIKNLKIQSEQQIYSRIMDARLKLENTDAFTKMATESPLFQARFAVVDSPEEYYITVAIIDLIEFMFRLYKKGMIDSQIWFRWEGYMRGMKTIPKFQKVWEKTKDVHANEFREFINSL